MKWFDIVHNRAQRRVPKWMRFLFFEVLGPMVGYCERRISNLKKQCTERVHYLKTGNNDEAIVVFDTEKVKYNQERLILYQKHMQRKMFSEELFTYHAVRKGELLPLGISMQRYQECLNDMDDILLRSWVDLDAVHNVDWWRCFAQTIDRVFMLVFFTAFLFTSFAVLYRGFGHQNQV